MAVETSLALQQLHHLLEQLEDAESLLDQGPRRITAAKKKIALAEQVCVDQKDEVKTFRKQVDEKSLNLKSHEAEILKLTRRLNEASSNKEYDIIQGQLDSEQLASNVTEDEVLGVMTQVDEAGTELKTAEAEYDRLIQWCNEIETEFRKKEQGIREDIDRLQGEISEAESAIPGGDLRGAYKRLRASMNSGALSEVQDGFCLACNTRLIAQDCVRIKIGEFVTCRQCGRILYAAE